MGEPDVILPSPGVPTANQELTIYDDSDRMTWPALQFPRTAKGLRGVILSDQALTIFIYGRDDSSKSWAVVNQDDSGNPGQPILANTPNTQTIAFLAAQNKITIQAGGTPPSSLTQSYRLSRESL